MKTLTYKDLDGDELVVVARRIVRLSKNWIHDFTYIHLDTGETLASKDSMKTLEARLNLLK